MALYKTSTAAGVCLLIAGVLALLSHFSGQINEGYASWESLIGGGAAIAIGLLFVIAGDIGKRTISIEQCLKELRNN